MGVNDEDEEDVEKIKGRSIQHKEQAKALVESYFELFASITMCFQFRSSFTHWDQYNANVAISLLSSAHCRIVVDTSRGLRVRSTSD